MRLINTSKHLLEKFDDPSNAEPYAILSHTWVLAPGKELELEKIRIAKDDDAQAKLARDNEKTRKTCELARAEMLSYAWIDTICIDQNSSSDKSEAINAMYRYYQDSKICFTYLCDVDGRGITLTDPSPNQLDTGEMEAVREEFTNARWFKRGWTLQELLAPPTLLFYDKNWKLLGSRANLCHTIARKTGIEPEVLQGTQPMQSCSIAQRMSWAAGRQTRRPEDKAYSLLGIFGVNMPMIYGEGERAFIRLQEEIIKISDDHSLFAWSMSKDPNNYALLAHSPDPFAGCTDITRGLLRTGNYPYSVNNRGISMQLNLIPWIPNVYIAPINCLRQPKQQRSVQLGLFLKRDKEDDKYIRAAVNGKDIYEFPPDALAEDQTTVSLHVKRDPGPRNVPSPRGDLKTINGFKIGPNLLKACWKKPREEIENYSQWDATQQIISFTPGYLPSVRLETRQSVLRGRAYYFPLAEEYMLCRVTVRFDEDYSLYVHCDLSDFEMLYYDAYMKKEVSPSQVVSVPNPSHYSHTFGVKRYDDGLDVYFPARCDSLVQDYIHVMLRRETLSAGDYEVWMLEIEAVDDFEGNPWTEVKNFKSETERSEYFARRA